jgi:cytochrome bd-type quinol oxidase subunit 1
MPERSPTLDVNLPDRISELLSELEQNLNSWRRIHRICIALLLLNFALGVLSAVWFDNKALAALFALLFFLGWVAGLVIAHLYYRSFMKYWTARGLTKADVLGKWNELYPPSVG